MTEQTSTGNNRTNLCRQQVEQCLTAEMQQLINGADNGTDCWRGSKADLYEAIYVAWDTHLIRDEATGCPMLLKQMMAVVCGRMKVGVPANPYSATRKACQRKGVRAASYMERYRYMLEQGNSHPLTSQSNQNNQTTI